MKLIHIPLEQLMLSTLNVRRKGGRQIDDLVASIRALGLIQPLLVRAFVKDDADAAEGDQNNVECDRFEIIAGQRRYRALLALAGEGSADPVPCAVMEKGDDAAALEASLAENLARLPMDEIDQHKAFAALVKQGRSVEEIAAHFGVTERLVRQRLAIAKLIAPILKAYSDGQIDPETLRLLTMADKDEQKAWFKLYKDEESFAPTGRLLKDWLFGGAAIPVGNALFEEADYTAPITADLFADERYYSDTKLFWDLQGKAITERLEQYRKNGWVDAIAIGTGAYFSEWDHVKTPKSKGGKVFAEVAARGKVTFHEGWITKTEARQRAKGEAVACGETLASPQRPELSKALWNYVGLHKHAAVRTELLAHPRIALRLSVAHMIAGSGLWDVRPERQRADKPEIAESIRASLAETGFAEERRAVRLLLGIEGEDTEPVVRGERGFSVRDTAAILDALMQMEDDTVLRVLAFVMAETLEAHTGLVEALGVLFGTDMNNWWKPDDVFFDLMRDKEAVQGMLKDVAGDVTANAHLDSTAKLQKQIVRDCLAGSGRQKVEAWLPRYMAFPATGYTGRFVGFTNPATSNDAALDAPDDDEQVGNDPSEEIADVDGPDGDAASLASEKDAGDDVETEVGANSGPAMQVGQAA